MHDAFEEFNSVDMLLMYPPFPSTLVVHGIPLTFKDALGTWRGRHCGVQSENDVVASTTAATVTTAPAGASGILATASVRL